MCNNADDLHKHDTKGKSQAQGKQHAIQSYGMFSIHRNKKQIRGTKDYREDLFPNGQFLFRMLCFRDSDDDY